VEKENTLKRIEKTAVPKIPQGAICDWTVDSDRKTIVSYYFVDGKWQFKNWNKKLKEADKDVQETLTKKYFEDENKKLNIKR
jgi:hypothetical protein